VRVPIGVIGVIYESRPNVTADAAGICLKSGNAVILRGGSDSFYSSSAIVNALHEGLEKSGLPSMSIQMVPSIDREAIDELLNMDKYIDVIIPRGGPKLIEYISAKSRIPLFKHLAGLCHTYIHQAADKEMAKRTTETDPTKLATTPRLLRANAVAGICSSAKTKMAPAIYNN
jgi:glutamate-5-semialdehyde dehydrogenase